MSYDANGNLLALGGYQFTWSDRRLTGASGAHSIAYTYDHNGIRTSKTIDGSTISYTVDENNNVIAQTDGTDTLRFVYDSNDAPVYMEYNGTVYYYEKNLQGDIVGILDTNGTTVVQYSYDIWGKLLGITGDLADTIGTANPLRYRGYYYDTETELYYLQSRYYSPDLMRFISQDDPVFSNAQGEPIGSNLYAYCLNNPVIQTDHHGHMVLEIAGATISFGTAVAMVAVATFAFLYLTDPNFRNAINQLFNYLINGCINGVSYLANTLSEAVRSANKGKKYLGNELHHIVAQGDRRAIGSRNILKRYKIDVNSSYNTVLIKKTLHKHIHTNSYHMAVYLILKASEIKNGSWNTKKYRIISSLVFMYMLLLSANRLV